MHERIRPGRGIALIAALLLALAPMACLDGPFARVNPHDAANPLQLTIVGGRDTITVAGEELLFQLVTAPVTNGYTVTWTSSHTTLLFPLGSGRYQVGVLPGVASTVEITAAIGGNSTTRDIVILPAP